MKVLGVGLNKTGTKTLRHCLQHWGYRHQTYDLQAFELYRTGQIDKLLQWMEDYDSFEDWPWPLMYREIDARFPDAKFVLTVRESPEVWYRSLCKMAIRMGPLNDFERHIYGYSMPHGHKQEHIEIYEKHNREVQAYFADRPAKLLTVCWEEGADGSALAAFLDLEALPAPAPRINASLPVYGGDKLWLAHLNRLTFQTKWKLIRGVRRVQRKIIRVAQRSLP